MSSEILDVLNIGDHEQQPKKKQKVEQPRAKPLTGINRELYQLLGQNTPPVAVRNQQKFKDRLNALEKPSSWTWASFKNGSREDGLRLHHWVKGSKEVVEAADPPYKFEKYNVHLNIPDFTEEEYAQFIAEGDDVMEVDESEEPSEVKTEDNEEKAEKVPKLTWNYEETRYLFDLAKAFDLRWIVIHDRYNFQDKSRSVEDLQERFYNVCQRILIYENEKDETSANTNLISNLNFSKKKEVDRKAYLNRLLMRTPAEIAEEECLLIEAKKFEVAAKKSMTERAQLLQLLDSPQASGAISQYLTSQGLTQLYNQLMTEKRKRRMDSPAPENPLTALNEKLKQQALAKQKQLQQEKLEQQRKKKENPIYTLFQKHLRPEEEQVYGLKVHQERISPGVFLRSQKTTTYKTGVQSRISSILNELGLGTKPVMITEKVAAKQDELHKAINQLLELKKQADKLDSESRILR
ncbi:CYFA0S31e00958g1_1 [Cyberlindnera fabianii]|uniref:SWR1-complex protein 4 n=1 Tax=Cyberlindnera fabianii TaxID=36022 RepID=A0A061BHK6_CYBFA|nr:SWR1-complex protein 4 [Cyberlindnera fabianii]CDR47374.1 CYFA0S31e00958g1_1 [Cyberlindnera fabianii]